MAKVDQLYVFRSYGPYVLQLFLFFLDHPADPLTSYVSRNCQLSFLNCQLYSFRPYGTIVQPLNPDASGLGVVVFLNLKFPAFHAGLLSLTPRLRSGLMPYFLPFRRDKSRLYT